MREKRPKIVVETGSDFAANKGDEAYFAAMVDLFNERLPGLDIVKFDGRPEVIGPRYGVRSIYSGARPLRRLLALWPGIREIATADAYVWGGGQILLDEHGFVSVPYRLSRPMLAWLFRRPVMSYAVGVGPLTGRFCRWLAKVCLRRFNVVTVRDRVSEEILRNCGLDGPIIQTVDAAIALESAGPERAREILRAEGVPSDRPIVAFLPWGPAYKREKSPVPVIFRRGRQARDKGGRRRYDRHVQAVAGALGKLGEQTGAFILLVAPDPTLAHGGDAVMARDIAAAMGGSADSYVLDGDFTPRELKAVLGLAEMAAGSRMHGLILSAGEGVPLVGICFSDKIRCFGEIIRQERFFINESEVKDSEEVYALFRRVWDERGELKKQVAARRDELCDEVRANVERLAELLEARAK